MLRAEIDPRHRSRSRKVGGPIDALKSNAEQAANYDCAGAVRLGNLRRPFDSAHDETWVYAAVDLALRSKFKKDAFDRRLL